MTTYTYALPGADLARLAAECQAAGLPCLYCNGGAVGSPDVHVVMDRDLSPAEVTTLDGVVAAHVPPTPDERRRDQALMIYDDPDSPGSLVELSGEYALLDLLNELQRLAGIGETGRAQLRNAVRAIIKPGGG